MFEYLSVNGEKPVITQIIFDEEIEEVVTVLWNKSSSMPMQHCLNMALCISKMLNVEWLMRSFIILGAEPSASYGNFLELQKIILTSSQSEEI
jgi:hypothetical protein